MTRSNEGISLFQSLLWCFEISVLKTEFPWNVASALLGCVTTYFIVFVIDIPTCKYFLNILDYSLFFKLVLIKANNLWSQLSAFDCTTEY